jgi:hypothetical protein
MIWLVWRQHRLQALAALLGLVALAAFLVPTGLAMHRAFDRDGVRDCLASATRVPLVELRSDSSPEVGQVAACKDLADKFIDRFGNLGTVAVLLWFLPLLAGLFLVTQVLMELMLRPHLLAPERRVLPTASSKAPNQLVRDWIVRSGIYGADGTRLAGGTLGSFSQQYCGIPSTDPKVARCLSEHGPDAYKLELFYPGHRIWLLQGIETALFVALAAILLLASVQWIHRRRVA